MNLRVPTTLLLLPTILLGACDSGSPSQPTPSPTAAASNTTAPTTSPQVAPTLQATSAPQPTIGPAPSPAPVQSPAPAEKQQLTLNPVQIETIDATRKGPLSTERTINLPPGFHIKVFAAGLGNVRWLGLSPDGLVYATIKDGGKVVTPPTPTRMALPTASTSSRPT